MIGFLGYLRADYLVQQDTMILIGHHYQTLGRLDSHMGISIRETLLSLQQVRLTSSQWWTGVRVDGILAIGNIAKHATHRILRESGEIDGSPNF